MKRATRLQHVAIIARYASSARRPPPPPKLPNSSRRATPQRPAQQAKPFKEEPQPPPPQKKKSPPPPTFTRSRAVPWVLSSILAGFMAFYAVNLVIEIRKPCQNPGIASISQQKDVSGRYEDTADSFDSEVGVTEVLMGVNGLRKQLARRCRGHVLEASCGTGRNIGYFNVDDGVESLTFVDLSPQMVEICKRKWMALMGAEKKNKLKPELQVRFLTGSVIENIPRAPAKEKYDTIIQTMGLCSTPTPVDLLANLVKHLDTTNPDARILLLEHGRSYTQWLNRTLDNAAEKHAEIHGCWFNRDIGGLVDEAARRTGMEVVSERRHHLGTTWVFELKPGVPAAAGLQDEAAAVEQQQPSGWRSWLGLK